MKKEVERNKEQSKSKKLKIILILISLILFLFFVLPCFHNWANNLKINLHFCNHTACMVYSLIWLVFTIIGIYYLIKKKEISRSWIFVYIAVLVIGIVLMNLIVCDSAGKMGFGFESSNNLFTDFWNLFNHNETEIPCKDSSWPDCKGYCHEIIDGKIMSTGKCVPIKKTPGAPGGCVCEYKKADTLIDTDGGEHPEIKGEIIEVNDLGENVSFLASDFCFDSYTLREYSCISEFGYDFASINCRQFYDDDSACCINGACTLECEHYDCAAYASDLGYSSWQDNVFGVSECESISEDFCGDKPDLIMWDDETLCCMWTCKLPEKNCDDCSPPSCDGNCPPGSSCIQKDDVCGCEPPLKFCEDSYPSCNGWCETGTCSSDGIGGCTCNEILNCTDNDGDGYSIEGGDCGVIDCNDFDFDVNPGATENCIDLIDNDCNGLIDCDDAYCEEQEICKTPCTESAKPTCGGYCPESYTCKYNELNDYCYCGTLYCKDSDDGFNLIVQGTCNDGVSNNIDTCTEDNEKVIEWMCAETGCKDFVYDCEYGCEEGACKIS